MNSSIEITDSAALQIQQIIKNSGGKADGIRVGVQGGGCAGLTYKLELEESEQEGDRIYPADNGVKLYVDKKSFLFIAGTVLDWSAGLNGKGFEFHNPNAVSTCGCGTSFTA